MTSGAETNLKNNKRSLSQSKRRNNRINNNKRNQKMIFGVGIDKWVSSDNRKLKLKPNRKMISGAEITKNQVGEMTLIRSKEEEITNHIAHSLSKKAEIKSCKKRKWKNSVNSETTIHLKNNNQLRKRHQLILPG